MSPASGAVSQHRLTLGAKHPLHCFPHMLLGVWSWDGAPGVCPSPWKQPLPHGPRAAGGLWHRAPIWWWLSLTSLLLLKPAPNLSLKHTKPCRSWRHRPSWGKEGAGWCSRMLDHQTLKGNGMEGPRTGQHGSDFLNTGEGGRACFLTSRPPATCPSCSSWEET